jgi:hypothetical protein
VTRFHRRLHLVKRAAGGAQTDRRLQVITVINNAGPSQLAGELCSPYLFSTSWTNEPTPRAMGRYIESEGRLGCSGCPGASKSRSENFLSRMNRM